MRFTMFMRNLLAVTAPITLVESMKITEDELSQDYIIAAQTQTQADASMIDAIIKIMELLPRPSVIANGGNPADHKSKINYVDLHEDKFVKHTHDGKGNSKVKTSSGHDHNHSHRHGLKNMLGKHH